MNSLKKLVALALIILGIVMIYIGGFHAPKVILPPIITGIGFFLIALVFFKDK
jgi:multidrug transporter EmrE-like cation transporter